MCRPRVFVGSKWGEGTEGEGTEGEGTVKEGEDGRRLVMQSPTAVDALRRITSAKLHEESEGQDLLEYALLCSLIALVAMGAVGIVGRTVHDVFWQAIVQNF